MKKITAVTALALAVIVALCAITPVAAANVDYKGGAEKFIFTPGSEYSPTDLFENFKNVMPGESYTQKIGVKNDSDMTVKIYMRSLGSWDGCEDFLSQMSLTVKQEGTNELFDAPADETAQLTDWVLLGTMKKGGETVLDVTLEVSPDMNNEYQGEIGYIDWEFRIEEVPEDEPFTGDSFRPALFIALGGICLVTGAALVCLKKIKNK